MIIVRSKNNVPIRLTDERWRHISTQHPEMDGFRDLLLETVSDPDCILEGDTGELLAVKEHASEGIPANFLIVAYKEVNEQDGFVLTGYFTRRISPKRKTIWKP